MKIKKFVKEHWMEILLVIGIIFILVYTTLGILNQLELKELSKELSNLIIKEKEMLANGTISCCEVIE